MLQNTLQLAPVVIVIRPEERGTSWYAIHSGSSKGSDKRVL